jgi:hypothetical protein
MLWAHHFFFVFLVPYLQKWRESVQDTFTTKEQNEVDCEREMALQWGLEGGEKSWHETKWKYFSIYELPTDFC